MDKEYASSRVVIMNDVEQRNALCHSDTSHHGCEIIVRLFAAVVELGH